MGFWIFIGLLLLGYFAGRAAESKHYSSIKEREKKWAAIPASTSKALPEGIRVAESRLALGSTVISIDYFKRFLASLRMLFGGELSAYSSLIDRGRREALLRMKESTPDANMFVNCRIETATLYSGRGNGVSSVEVFAYATALRISRL